MPPRLPHLTREAIFVIPRKVRIGLGALTVVGGLAGIGIVLLAMYRNAQIIPILAIVMAAYVYGVWSGISMLQLRPGWLRRNEIYWLMQMPALTTTFIGYWFASGAYFFVYLKLFPVGLGFNAFLGSFFGFNFMRPEQPTVGLNLIALGAWFYLRRLKTNAP